MTEATDQSQTPAVSKFPPIEIPAAEIPPEAATETPESQTPEPEPPAQDETALTEQIAQLWRLHADYKGSIKNQTENLRSLRSELGKKLSEMKQLLARPGCAGGWSAYLREHRIPRATADRLVTKHERSLNPNGNRLTESITEPTESEIQNLFDKIAPKLRRVSPTPASAYRFVELLLSSLALECRVSEEGLTMVKPSQKTEVVETMQEAQDKAVQSPAEPVPVVADAPAECDGESMEISVA